MSRARYCHRRLKPPGHFDKRSFRTLTRGDVRIRIGCPHGEWRSRAQRCRVGTQAQAILKPVPANGRCPAGSKRP